MENTDGANVNCCRGRWSNRYLDEFIDNSTFNGVVAHVFRGESKLRRLIWGLIVFGATFMMIYMISLSLERFSEKPTASTIAILSLDEAGTPFPGVTICNLNLERNTSNNVSVRTYELVNYLFNADESFRLTGLNASSVLDICNKNLLESPEEVRNASLWEAQSPDHAIDDLIFYCGYVQGIDSDVVPCKQDFKPVMTSAGICYTFNSTEKLATNTGLRYGLKLILRVDPEKRPSFNGKSGVKVVIHDGDDIARPNLYGINLPPGQAIDIGVRKRATDDQTAELHCVSDYKLPFIPNVEYSQFACRLNALYEHIASNDTCGCIIQPDRPATGHYANTRNCTLNDSCCLIRQYTRFNPNLHCPLPCHFEFYEYSNSYSSFPNGRLLDQLADSLNKSEEEIKEEFLSINVFVDDLQVTTTITQYTVGIEGLLGEIGGQMGLFLTISVITLLEIAVLVLDILIMLICPKIKEKIRKVDKRIFLHGIEAGNGTINKDGTEVS